MKCSEVMEKLEELSPAHFAESWDNVGLLAGRSEKDIKKIILALDATDAVIEQAIQVQADMLLTHHPMIFKPLKRVNTDDFIGRRIYNLLRHDICYYAMHTNFDVMGMADAAADELDLRNREVLDITYEDEIAKEGIGRVGRLSQIMSLAECAVIVKNAFQVEHVKVFGGRDAIIETVAICPGSGKGMIEKALSYNADVLITGDIDHHTGLDAMAQGLTIIDAGHYGIEKIFLPYMKSFFARELPDIQIVRAEERNPFWMI